MRDDNPTLTDGTRNCPSCGVALPFDAPMGRCAPCLQAAGLLTQPIEILQGRDSPITAATENPGERVGRYKLLQRIGEGGMGNIWMAEQEEPVRRRVAIKVIKLGMDTRSVIARFEAERQALALMDHPNIAKVLDAGVTETGRPFFVMELVRGIRITDYCDQNNLSTQARLDLFIKVCHAIQHAHQKGIIHRDIKPSNILVTLHDGVAVPKVIDFGIAKAISGQRLTDKTLFTAFEQFIGTPAYMSPEQAEMSGLDIDTRSDVYALGVLLYELLTGQTPFDSKRLVQAGIEEIRRIIREEEPPKPSTRLSTLTQADLTSVAKHQQSEPAKLRSRMRGDLDWVVMKCLEKDRTRRYETANGLAADVQRHLRDEAVEATPPRLVYSIQKVLRRRRREIVVGTLLLALAACGAAYLLQNHRTRVLRAAINLEHLRQEELGALNRIIAGSASTQIELDEAQTLAARVVKRVKSGSASKSDYELINRFLARSVWFNGRFIQKLDSPNLSFNAWTTGDAALLGFGVLLRPAITIDGTPVRMDDLPIYLPGGHQSVGNGVELPLVFTSLGRAAGRRIISCILEAQLVRSEGPLEAAKGVRSKDYQAIGDAVRITLPPRDFLFVHKLPMDYPTELFDEGTARKIAADLVVTACRITMQEQKGCVCKLEIGLHRISPPVPLALRVDLLQIGNVPLGVWFCSLVIDQDNALSCDVGELGGEVELKTMAGVDTDDLWYEATIRLPQITSLQFGNPKPMAKIAFRSDRSAALRAEKIDYFLSFPEIRKEVAVTIGPP